MDQNERASRQPRGALSPGTLVDERYVVREPLGRGGYGTVYRADDVLLARPTALKTLMPSARGSAPPPSALFREAALLARLRHENVAAVYTAGTHAGAPYAAMELVEGTTLRDLIGGYASRSERTPIARALSILSSLARGLGAVHAVALVHADLKPENVIVEARTGRVVLVDFGLARTAERDPLRDETIVGTPAYLAPEICNAPYGPPTAQSDLYALGCLATELLVLELPFDHETSWGLFRLHGTAVPPRLASLRPELAPVDPLISKLLAKRPVDRPPSAAAVARELDALARTFVLTEQPPGSIPVPPGARPELRALVVDDDPVAARLLTRAVHRAFAGRVVDVTVVASAAEALLACESRTPDLVLLDYLLPDGNGFDLLSALRHRRLASGSRVVLVSEVAASQERWRFRILGVDEFVGKPVSVDEVVELLAER